MKKRSKKFNFSRRLSFTLIVIFAFVLIAVGVFAYGTSSPSTFGHTFSELSLPPGCKGMLPTGVPFYHGTWSCLSIPVCTGSNQGLQWDGGKFTCATVSNVPTIQVIGGAISTASYGRATCRVGTLISGGCECGSGTYVVSSGRLSQSSPNTWQCKCSGLTTVTVTAYCMS